jgi:hypothetical protein
MRNVIIKLLIALFHRCAKSLSHSINDDIIRRLSRPVKCFFDYFFRLLRGQTDLGDVQLLKHVQHVKIVLPATTISIKRFALVPRHFGEEQTHAAKVRDAGEDQTRPDKRWHSIEPFR